MGGSVGEVRQDSRHFREVPDGFLTRQDILERTGITNKELNSLIARRKVEATARSKRNWALFPESVVAKILRVLSVKMTRKRQQPVYGAAHAVQVFKMLEAKVPTAKILLKTKLHPEALRAIEREYHQMNESLVLTKEVLNAIYKLPIEGAYFPFENGSDLLDLLERIAKGQHCVRCGKQREGVCAPCHRAEVAREIEKENEARETARLALLTNEERGPQAPRSDDGLASRVPPTP